MKKLFLLTLFTLFTLTTPLISGETYSLEQDIDFKISSSINACNLTVVYPNTTILIKEQIMTNNKGYSNYTISPDSLIQGEYKYYSDCNVSGTFNVNNNAIELTTPRAIVNSAMLFLLVGLFIFTLFMSSKMERFKRDPEGEIIGINMLRYTKTIWFGIAYGILMGIFFIASNIGYGYLGDELFANIFFTLYEVMMRLAIPMILILAVWLIAQVVQDKQIKSMIERGVDFGGKGL